MHKNYLVIFLLFYLFPLFLFGQCPDSKWLWNRLIFLRDSSHISSKLELQELLQYESSAEYCKYRNDSTRILLLQRISGLSMADTAYARALYQIQKAIKIVSSNTNNSSINPTSQIRNYYVMALVYKSLKKTTEKIKAYDSCIAIARRLNMVNLYFMVSLLEKVKYLNDIGDYNLCINYADNGITMSSQYIPEKGMSKYGDAASFLLGFTIQKVNALLVLKRCDEAEVLLIHKIAECIKRKAREYLGSLYEQLAMAKMQQKKYGKVILYFKQALQYNSELGYKLSCKVNIHNMGYFLYDEILKNDKKALYYYKRALGYVNDNPDLNKPDSIITLKIYSNIANIYVRSGRYDSAQYFFKCAFDQIKKGTNETQVLNSSLDEFIENQKVEYLTGLFIDKGDAFYKQYKVTKDPLYINEAIRIYKLTDLLLERIKMNQSELQSKLFWRKDTHHLYEQAIEACIAAGKQEEAFYFFERSRAILLYDQINEQRWVGEDDILKQQELGNNIRQLEKELLKADSASLHFREAQKKLFGYKEDQVHLFKLIKERNPLYYQSFIDTSFTSLNDIREGIIKQQQSLVEIFAGDSTVYSMIITSKDTYFNRIDKRTYDSAVNLCILYMSDPEVLNRNSQFNLFAKSSHRLYDLIFQHKNLPEGRIIISPDGRYFPFEALVTGFEGKDPVYFLQKHAVSYTYSARYLMNKFVKPSKYLSGNFLGIAPVNFPEKQHLSALPGSDRSVKNLEAYFNASEDLIGKEATRDNFLHKFGRYRIIQLYTHSSDSSSEGEPVIYFADQPLYLSGLNSVIQPITKLVVLSACETGTGQFYQGEGVFSFNRAFAALGIPSCITNLWSIENESTYLLTELFYKNVSYGLPIDVALQQAKLQFIKTSPEKKRLPYYWAATILAGKTDAIEFKKKSNYWMITAGIIGILGVFFFWKLYFRNRNKRNIEAKNPRFNNSEKTQ